MQRTDVLNAKDPWQEVYVTNILFTGIIVNTNFLGYIFSRYKNTVNIITILILVMGLNLRIYGLDNLKDNLGNMLINSFTFLMFLPYYMYCSTAMMNIIKK